MDASVNTLTTKAELGFAEIYEHVKAALPGADAPWLREIRSEAFRAFERQGLPHRRVEEWKYTDLRARLEEAFAPASKSAAVDANRVAGALGTGLGGLDCHLVVIVDGRLAPELSDLDFLGKRGEAMDLAAALAAPPAWLRQRLGDGGEVGSGVLLDLNTALMSDGVALAIKAGARVEKPVHIVHLHTAPEASGAAMRHVIALGEGAEATLIESHVSLSDAPSQTNVASEVRLAAGAAMNHVKFQNEAHQAAHLSTWRVTLEGDARYDAFQFSEGAGLARSELHMHFAGRGAEARVGGVFLGAGKQHLDTTLFVDHAVPDCRSRILFKGVLDEEARGIFQGKIAVRREAQKTDSKEMAQGLLLSERAEFDSKPELEIFADDVVCGHGSTSGQIDEELMFYLRARGIGEVEARSLLIQAFAGEALELIADEAVREALMDEVRGWLTRGVG